MQRPTISNSPTGLRARRIFPRPPALLVGPSWLLRGDDVGDPRLDGSAIDHLDVGRLSKQPSPSRKKRTHRPVSPSIQLEGPFQEFLVRRSRHDDRYPIKQPIPRLLPGFRKRFFRVAYWHSL